MTATLQSIPFTPGKFDVHVVLPFSTTWGRHTADEAEALELAHGQVGQNQTQVTITTAPSPYVHGTFAVRHITWRDGTTHDSGWRCWVNDKFVGGVPATPHEKAQA